ncbi:MAG TPA: LysM domain-containing protein [Kofleriaceae bacterium]|nr:LysM domain-containing protein [Kofleriaceae bacterium]
MRDRSHRNQDEASGASPASAIAPGKRTLSGAGSRSTGAAVQRKEAAPPGDAAAPMTYTVLVGESLAAIAAKLRTTVDALEAANRDLLKAFPTRSGATVPGFKAGAVIKVPATATAANATAGPATAAPATPPATGASAHRPAAGADFFGGVLGPLGEVVHDGADAIENAVETGLDAVGAGVDRLGGMVGDAWDFLTGAGGPKTHGASGHDATGGGDAASHGAVAAGASSAAGGTSVPAGTSSGGTSSSSGGGGSSTGVPGTAPMTDLTDAERGARLSTIHADEKGTVDKFGMSKSGRDAAKARGQWLSASDIKKAGNKKSGQGFVDSVDALVDATSFTEDQGKVITAAKEFAATPKTLTAEQEKRATIDWGKAQLTLDGVSLNPDLQARLVKYVRFLAWAGLVTGPTKIGSVMRSPQTAHKLSVAWMFNLAANKKGSTLHKAENRQKLVANVTRAGGSDLDGNQWLSPATVDGLKAKKDDDAALYDYIETTAAPEANKVQVQSAIAAEGYKTPDKRHPNVLGGTSVSNHLLGEAVDMYPPFVFSNLFDPVIDAIAMYFGLWRAVKDDSSSPEHWHYERLGMPPGAESADPT